MALRPCRECAEYISSKAKTCPKCGTIKPVRQTSLLAKVVVGLFILGVLEMLVGLAANQGSGGRKVQESPTNSVTAAAAEQSNQSHPKSLYTNIEQCSDSNQIKQVKDEFLNLGWMVHQYDTHGDLDAPFPIFIAQNLPHLISIEVTGIDQTSGRCEAILTSQHMAWLSQVVDQNPELLKVLGPDRSHYEMKIYYGVNNDGKFDINDDTGKQLDIGLAAMTMIMGFDGVMGNALGGH